MVLLKILAILVSVLYVTKLELYAGLLRDLPSPLPSYVFFHGDSSDEEIHIVDNQVCLSAEANVCLKQIHANCIFF